MPICLFALISKQKDMQTNRDARHVHARESKFLFDFLRCRDSGANMTIHSALVFEDGQGFCFDGRRVLCGNIGQKFRQSTMRGSTANSIRDGDLSTPQMPQKIGLTSYVNLIIYTTEFHLSDQYAFKSRIHDQLLKRNKRQILSFLLPRPGHELMLYLGEI